MGKIETTIKHSIAESAVFFAAKSEHTNLWADFKGFIKNVTDVPFETLEDFTRLSGGKYTVNDYGFGKFLYEKVREAKPRRNNPKAMKLTLAEEHARRNFMTNIVRSYRISNIIDTEETESKFMTYNNTITIGCRVDFLKSILKRSSLEDILFMIYLHEEGHRQDSNINYINYLENVIKSNKTIKGVIDKEGRRLTYVYVSDRVFKKILNDDVLSEFKAWENAFNLLKKKFKDKCNKTLLSEMEYLKTYALYSYVKRHKKCTKERRITIADYVFISK